MASKMPDSKFSYTYTPLCLSLSRSLTFVSTPVDRAEVTAEVTRQDPTDEMAHKKTTKGKKGKKISKRTKELKYLESRTAGDIVSWSPAGTSVQSVMTPDAGGASEAPVHYVVRSARSPVRPSPQLPIADDEVASSQEKLISFTRSEILMFCAMLFVVLVLFLLYAAGSSGSHINQCVTVTVTNHLYTCANLNPNPNPTRDWDF